MSDQYVQANAWQQERRKPGTAGVAVEGFAPPPGVSVRMTLWLPPAKPESTVRIVNGRSTVEFAEATNNPSLIEARLKLLASVTHPREGVVSVGLELIDYAAALIQCNYNVTDAELEGLLKPGPWQNAIIEHAVGGEDFINTLANVDPFIVELYSNTGRRAASLMQTEDQAGLLTRLLRKLS